MTCKFSQTKKKEGTQITNITNERGDMTLEPVSFKGILKEDYGPRQLGPVAKALALDRRVPSSIQANQLVGGEGVGF